MSTDTDMKIPIDPSRAQQLAQNIQSIRTRITNTIQQAAQSNTSSHQTPRLKHTATNPPRLVAVSKLKPASDILALHQCPASHDHFGENYVQELLEKSRLLPREIKWHFIGGLQSNKCTQLAREVPNLWAVESVDSVKKANLLDKGRGEVKDKVTDEPLRVFVQVNTSGEDSKSGVEPKSDELRDVCQTIHSEKCVNLKLQGLMTIGAIARSQETTAENENEDFDSLRENRDWVAKELGVDAEDLELSMGMSEDFEGAIVQGSDEVRVGTTILGPDHPKMKPKCSNTQRKRRSKPLVQLPVPFL